MRLSGSLLLTTWLGLAGCAAQAPEAQLARPSTVRVCNGNACADQDRRVASMPIEASQDDERLQALTRIAERDANGAYDVGLRLLRGDGVERNSHAALEWLRKAGDNGHSQAQLALGRIYLMGLEEMGPDPAEAESWLMRAAAKGSAEATKLLPKAREAKKDEQLAYEVREAYRTSWITWYGSAPYYWVWGPSGWYLP
ncbi:tetratricopeptide repeat protein [Cupriavidus sp. AU9028]|uniref:tetratricopeptide repeat protein n=1 Tax=Cupriavidus sp. AU9028 TaxID=2871157 RepID=UPI001C9860F7|nr:sel1 repeat family protein [Cupriavidus sp. AU9028]MBY4897116.1 sel1 repeat family protein [Cupriavidus sp. AU9028]